MYKPLKSHLKIALNVLRYLKGSQGKVSWECKKQYTLSKSSTQAEYKGSSGWIGVKEKSINKNKTNTPCIGLFTTLDGTLNEVTPVFVVKEVETPSVVDMTVENKKLSSMEDTTVLVSFSPLSMPVTTSAGNTSSNSSYDNVTGKPSGKKLNICNFFAPRGDGIDL
uniref:Uncharacterized protein n=1 Tax=Tanacetum cinerariifolium TaxID=118510 RepID=A0A699J0V8_TANCI|nr:hypothetical protein [Tanacetum cinerariifolium]